MPANFRHEFRALHLQCVEYDEKGVETPDSFDTLVNFTLKRIYWRLLISDQRAALR